MMNTRYRAINLAILLLTYSALGCVMEVDDETDAEAEHVEEDESQLSAQYAILRGKFIDENDWWWDGKVPGASINVYSIEDNTFLGGTSTNQDGWYGLAGPFFQKTVRLVADPPPHAHCPSGAENVVIFVDSYVKQHDFKDECEF
ncbi:hypothetical protein WMF26_32015 [Sorangium sp. So ce185]|uniref:hypothetical protein n=1 Tax=Sorangium sp. So ce185 TaxID=3133287 RepID=UPI003F6362D0